MNRLELFVSRDLVRSPVSRDLAGTLRVSSFENHICFLDFVELLILAGQILIVTFRFKTQYYKNAIFFDKFRLREKYFKTLFNRILLHKNNVRQTISFVEI